MRKIALALVIAVTGLSACSTKARVYAPDAAVAAARYVAPPPAEVILYTSLNAASGSGAHSGLVISGSQRVLFDPAGTFDFVPTPERHDVLYGLSDRNLDVYRDFHVRPTHNLVEQRLTVPQSVADALIARAEQMGPVGDALCSSSISSLLRTAPGFESLRGSAFPRALSRNFGALPGVQTVVWTQETYRPGHGVPFMNEEPAAATPGTN